MKRKQSALERNPPDSQQGVVVQVTTTHGQGLCPVDPIKRQRTAALRIRLTPSEHAAISAVAAASGLGICSFARMATIRASGLIPSPSPRKPDAHARALAEWTGALGKIGNCLNQLARDRHLGFDAPQLTVDDVAAELRKLRETILQYHADRNS